MYICKNTWTPQNKHLCITTTRNKNGPNHRNTKQRSLITNLITVDINLNMIGANDLLTKRTGRIIEHWLDEENYIILNNYETTHKDGGTLANSKVTSLFDKF